MAELGARGSQEPGVAIRIRGLSLDELELLGDALFDFTSHENLAKMAASL